MRRGWIALALGLYGLTAGPACNSTGGGAGSGGGGEAGSGGSGGATGCGAFHCLRETGICAQYSDASSQEDCTADPTATWGPNACDNSTSFGGCKRTAASGECSYQWYPDDLVGTKDAIRNACLTGSGNGAWIDLPPHGTGGSGGDGGTGGAGGTGGEGGTGGTGGVAKSGPITECATYHCDQGVAGPKDVCIQFDDHNILVGVICDGQVKGDGPCPDTTVGGCESQPDTPNCTVTVIYDPSSAAQMLCENRPDERWLSP